MLFQVLGHLYYVFFFPNKCLKKIQRERENNRNKHTREERGKRGGDKERGEGGKSKQAKIKDWVGFLLAQECRCLQPAVYAGRGTELCQTEQT